MSSEIPKLGGHAAAHAHGHTPPKSADAEFSTFLLPPKRDAKPKPKPGTEDASHAPAEPKSHPRTVATDTLARLQATHFVFPHLGAHVEVAPPKDAAKEKQPKPVAPPAQVEAATARVEDKPVPVIHAPAQVASTVLPTSTLSAPERSEPVASVAAPPPPLPIEPALAADDSLRVLLLPHSARVSVETAEAGRLSLRVDVRDGVAHVRASGEAASLVDARHSELRVALAQEGLSLGNFELPQKSDQNDPSDREARDASGFRRASPKAKPATEDEKPLDGGLHIHA